jgi:hypothetical protein
MRTNSLAIQTAWTVVAIAIAYVFVPIARYLDYCDGYWFRGHSAFVLPIAFVLGALLAIPLFVWLVKNSNVYGTGRKLFLGALLACVFFSPFLFGLLDHPGESNYLRGMRDRLDKDVDPEKLQTWALRELSDHWNSIRVDAVGDQIQKEIPASVKGLLEVPPRIWPSTIVSAIDQPHLEIVWGSGFGHWGILVGGKDFFCPPKTENGPSHCESLKWRPGIYVFFWD